MIFPEFVFALLVYGALGMSGGGIVLLLALLARDARNGRIW